MDSLPLNPKQESAMTSKLHIKRIGFTLGAALVLGAAGGVAAAPATESPAAQPPLQVALATGPASVGNPAASPDATAGGNPIEARVRAAAAEGSDALRRYVHRTRMIYNFNYWDFAKKE